MKNKRLAMALGIALGATMHIPEIQPRPRHEIRLAKLDDDRVVQVNKPVRYSRKMNRAQRRARRA